MKKKINIKLAIALFMVLTLIGCKKFLNVEPIDSLSGNNFWKNENDAETFTLEIYRIFRKEIGIDRPTLLAGDLRNAPVLKAVSNPNRTDIPMIANGQIRTLINTVRINDGGTNQANTFWVTHVLWNTMDNWQPYYKVIQSSNILFDKVDMLAENDPSISASTVKRYKAEAVFMRCLSYFFLIRLYGDVPYYTNAYNDKPLPRTNHIEVAQKCIAELASVKDDLPWTYEDPANRGVRAMRGAALALMMHLNMWCAGFDEKNERQYYTAVDQLGDDLRLIGMEEQGAYALLPIEETSSIFNGRTKEGLFEIPTNPNYYDPNSSTGKEAIGSFRRVFLGHVLHAPYFTLNAAADQSELTYQSSYMKTIFPEDEVDLRKFNWFRDRPEMYKQDPKFLYFKFFNFAYGENNTINSVGFSQVVFRMADAILLQAEALAKLGEETKAITLLNQIRTRAGAGIYPSVNNYDNNLADAIYWERCKELMGEGHYYYDLVRTRKILDANYCWSPMSYSAYLQGAWTWPIREEVLKNNPYMTLNDYWR